MSASLAKRTDRFVETVIDEEAVVMDLDSGDFFSLGGTAYAIWGLIDGTRTRAEIIAALVAGYAAPEAEVAADFDAFVGDLAERGFIAQG